MKLVECDQTTVPDDDINSQLQIVSTTDPVVGNDERISKQHDASFAVWILNQQTAAGAGETFAVSALAGVPAVSVDCVSWDAESSDESLSPPAAWLSLLFLSPL